MGDTELPPPEPGSTTPGIELASMPPEVLSLILSWTRLADLRRIRSVCRLWSVIFLVYARLDPPELIPCQTEKRSKGGCSVCHQLMDGARSEYAAREKEADLMLEYLSWAAPNLTPSQLVAKLKPHRLSLKMIDYPAASTFYRACLEGNLATVKWLYVDLGYTPATSLFDALWCDAYTELPSADPCGNDGDEGCLYWAMRKMILFGAGETVKWLIGALSGADSAQQYLMKRFIVDAGSVSEARTLAEGFMVNREHLACVMEPEGPRPFLMFIKTRRFGLAAWFARHFALSRAEVGAMFESGTCAECTPTSGTRERWLLAARWFRQEGLLD